MQAGDEAIDRRTLPFKSAVVILLKVDISALGRESFRKAENEAQRPTAIVESKVKSSITQ